jgi:stage II sporulation protein D
MKKIPIILMLALMCVGCNGATKGTSDAALTVGTIGKDTPIKRSQVAKMLALSVYGIDDIEQMERKIVFEDTDADKPYDKYINAAFTAGLISGADETHFEPEGYLSLEQAQFLLNKLDKSSALKLQYKTEDRKKPISAAMWVEVFERAMELNSNAGVVSCEVVPLATGESCEELGSRFIMTDRGLLSSECCPDDGYTDYTVTALLKDKEILAYKEIVNNEPTIVGAVVTEKDEDGITVDMGGVERYFYAEGDRLAVGDSIGFKYKGDTITETDSGAGVSDTAEYTDTSNAK